MTPVSSNTSSWLATLLDQEMLQLNGVRIASRLTPDWRLPRKTGGTVAGELGGRYLLRYVLSSQVGRYASGSSDKHWVTPTPYAPDETVSWLALPNPNSRRTHVLVLDPAKIPFISGPRWIRFGKGIEYLLPDGFPRSAVLLGWEVEVT